MKSIVYILLFSIVLMMSSCVKKSSDDNNVNEEIKDDYTSWLYYSSVDDLTNKITADNATIMSTNRKVFDTNGNTTRLYIGLTYDYVGPWPNTTHVIIAFYEDKGLCRFSSFQGSGFLAVFDSGNVDERWTLISMFENRKALYIDEPSQVNAFISRLKSSKQARIQVKTEILGNATFDFDVSGLDWRHY